MKETQKRCTAILLAAGSGRRMESPTAKQFLLLRDKPVIWYSLRAVEQSEIIDDCILVAGAGDIAYVQHEIVEKYNFRKVDKIVAGGGERWESVYNALCLIKNGDMTVPNHDGYVFIHDGARPFLSEEILKDTCLEVCRSRACVAAVPVKDTIKKADENGFITKTPDRRFIWAVQTPQVFETELIVRAYEMLHESCKIGKACPAVTDDAMVVERMLGLPVRLVNASYGNIKITTPEDMALAEALLQKYQRRFSDPKSVRC